MTLNTVSRPAGHTLNEDWLATIIGLAIVVIIALGVIGPGPQSVTINAPAGETRATTLLPLDNWSASMTLDGKSATVAETPAHLEAGHTYVLSCSNNTLQPAPDGLPAGVPEAPTDRAQVVVLNACDGDVSLKYMTRAALPWPVFKIL